MACWNFDGVLSFNFGCSQGDAVWTRKQGNYGGALEMKTFNVLEMECERERMAIVA